MQQNESTISPARKLNWERIILFAGLVLLLADLGLGLVLMAQRNPREQAKSRLSTSFAYPVPVPQNLAYLRTFAVDSLGRVWISTPPEGGLSMLNPDGSWTTYTTGNSQLPSDKILALASDESGRIAIMTSAGVSTLASDGTWISVLKDNLPPLFTDANIEPYSMAFGKQGEIWITADRFSTLYMLPGDGSWTSFDKPNASDSLQAVDRQGTVWIGGGFNGLFKQAGNGQWTFLPIPGKIQEYNNGSIQDAAFDRLGWLWVAADRDGLFYIDSHGKWTSYTDLLRAPPYQPSSLQYSYGPADERVLRAQKIIPDSQGNVWFTSAGCVIPIEDYYRRCDGEYSGQNLSKLTLDGRLITYPSEYLGLTDINDRITGLGVDEQGRVWIGHDSGVTLFDETSPFQAKTDLYTELVRLSVGIFWSETVAVWLILGVVLAFLSSRAMMDRGEMLWFIAGFLGWFVLNSLNRYFLTIAYSLNLRYCPFQESGAPDCASLYSLGLILFMMAVNLGIPLFLFKTRRLGGMWGFIIAFIMNTIMQFILGRPEQFMFLFMQS